MLFTFRFLHFAFYISLFTFLLWVLFICTCSLPQEKYPFSSADKCTQLNSIFLYFTNFSAFMVYHERDIFHLFLNATVPLDWNGGRYSIFGTQSSDDS